MTELGSSPIEYYATDASPHFVPYGHQTAGLALALIKRFVKKSTKCDRTMERRA